ncbi:hypothetical protein FHG64_13175 [Antarcticibacterium flavum]|uniref:Uncharacterized protein n=1 Tax=Antarcticibacterium flavum TaxID=2058175 RepID=A0A5B7X6A8_9FLAO|nr:hypothetical protein [Antarcticibacterium sp. W02-3]QCY70278.1 hypothetical protein FHG64_13175 [Antarcticibacterium flavum]
MPSNIDLTHTNPSCSLLNSHYSLLTSHYSLLITHFSILTTQYSFPSPTCRKVGHLCSRQNYSNSSPR